MSFYFKISGFHIRNQWLLNLILIKYYWCPLKLFAEHCNKDFVSKSD